MSRLLLVIALTSLVAGCHADGQTHESAAPEVGGEDVQSIGARLEEAHRLGLLKKDYAALDKLWADDLTFVNARGQLLSKANRLDNLRSGATAFKSIDASEIVTRSTGKQSAVTTARARIDGQYSGAESSGDYRVTMVWAQPKGHWQLVAVQMTPIQK